jgi:hypothetical protein
MIRFEQSWSSGGGMSACITIEKNIFGRE